MRPKVFLSLAAAALLGCSRGAPGRPARSTGKAAPDFRLDTLSHGRFYLNAQRGRAVVLVFWWTTCQACKQEMVALKGLRDELGPRGVVVASVCTDPEDLGEVRRIVGDLGVGYPVLLDRGGGVAGKYGVRAVPTTVVVDPKGRMRLVREGYSPALMRQLRRTVEGLLEEMRSEKMRSGT